MSYTRASMMSKFVSWSLPNFPPQCLVLIIAYAKSWRLVMLHRPSFYVLLFLLFAPTLAASFADAQRITQGVA